MLNNKKIIAIVPARGGSKGVPLKNIQPVLGIPIVARVGHLAKKIPMIDCCVLSTDHPEIKKIGEESGLLAPFFRPAEISGDSIGDLPVLTHALEEMETRNKCTYDIVVLLPPTSPLRQKKHVEDTIKKLVFEGYDSVWTVSESDSKFHPFKQLKIVDGLLDYYDPEGKNIISRQQLDTLYYRNGAAYAMTRECLLEQKTLKGKRLGYVLIEEPLVNIDYRWEFQLADFLLKSRQDSEL